MLKWGWETKKTELENLTRFECLPMLSYPGCHMRVTSVVLELTHVGVK